jgi:GTP-binding protein
VNGFVDEAVIHVSSGNGGDGCVSFRREKFVPRGGPDGGDGGKGGDVVFAVRANLKTLSNLKLKRHYAAENGRQGMGNGKHGRNGNDVEINVPPGTLLKNRATGEILADLTDDGERFVLLKGGKGGKGNSHYATPTNQAPRYAQEGQPGEALEVIVELSLIADIGMVGMPNAGKSTLLSVLTNAHPLIGDYPFTTKTPNLGLLRIADREVILADIPGIVEGASRGKGLGLRFLRHIARCSSLMYLVDLGTASPVEIVGMMTKELDSYAHELAQKPRLLVGTKLDLEGARENLALLRQAFPGERILAVSAFTREGLPDVARALLSGAGSSK